MENKWPFIVNLCNSIIGVSVLAMPFVMKQCGLILGSVMILVSGLFTRVACYLLVSGAQHSRRRSYESYAAHVFGPLGKRITETMNICFLMSTLMAFFVVIGDLGPDVISTWLGHPNTQEVRITVMIVIALVIVTPFSLLKNVESLNAVSGLAVVFYAFFVLRMFLYALPDLLKLEWVSEIRYWNFENFLQCLPIVSLSLACQTTVFALTEAMPDFNTTIMNAVVAGAVNICSFVYLLVGAFGYITFYKEPIGGDILLLFESTSLITQLMKLGFMLSVAVSFPLMIFPCRAAIYTLLLKPPQKSTFEHAAVDVIPDVTFKIITIVVVMFNLTVAIMVPNVELILGLSGSLIGSVVCFIMPAVLFNAIAPRTYYYSKFASQIVLCAGLLMLVLCTYVTLQSGAGGTEHVHLKEVPPPPLHPSLETTVRIAPLPTNAPDAANQEKRQEPPLPIGDPVNVDAKKEEKAGGDAGEAGKVVDQPAGKVAAKGDEHEVEKKQHNEILEELKHQRKEQEQLIQQQKHIIQELEVHKKEFHDGKKVEKPEGGGGNKGAMGDEKVGQQQGGPVGNVAKSVDSVPSEAKREIGDEAKNVDRVVNSNQAQQNVDQANKAEDKINVDNRQQNRVDQRGNIVDQQHNANNVQQNVGDQQQKAVIEQQSANNLQQNVAGQQIKDGNAQQSVDKLQQNVGNQKLNAAVVQENANAQQNVGNQLQNANNAQQNVGNQQQNANNVQHNVGNQQQNANNAQQNFGNQQQNANNAQQNVGNQQQNANNVPQNVGNQQQNANNAQQNVGNQQPNANNPQQNVGNQQENVGNQQQNVNNQQQNVNNQQQNVENVQQNVANVQHNANNQQQQNLVNGQQIANNPQGIVGIQQINAANEQQNANNQQPNNVERHNVDQPAAQQNVAPVNAGNNVQSQNEVKQQQQVNGENQFQQNQQAQQHVDGGQQQLQNAPHEERHHVVKRESQDSNILVDQQNVDHQSDILIGDHVPQRNSPANRVQPKNVQHKQAINQQAGGNVDLNPQQAPVRKLDIENPENPENPENANVPLRNQRNNPADIVDSNPAGEHVNDNVNGLDDLKSGGEAVDANELRQQVGDIRQRDGRNELGDPAHPDKGVPGGRDLLQYVDKTVDGVDDSLPSLNNQLLGNFAEFEKVHTLIQKKK